MQAGLIFLLRVIDVGCATVRMMLVSRGDKLLTWVLGFIGSSVFVSAIRPVIQHTDNWWNIIGYAGGFATGIVLGMLIEDRIAKGITFFRIISSRHGDELAEKLRAAGYGVTEISAWGRDGQVAVLHCYVQRKKSAVLTELIRRIDEEAFVCTERVLAVRRGFWHS